MFLILLLGSTLDSRGDEELGHSEIASVPFASVCRRFHRLRMACSVRVGIHLEINCHLQPSSSTRCTIIASSSAVHPNLSGFFLSSELLRFSSALLSD